MKGTWSMVELRAHAERLSLVFDEHPHYEGCEREHVGCMMHRLLDEIERQQGELTRLRRNLAVFNTAFGSMLTENDQEHGA